MTEQNDGFVVTFTLTLDMEATVDRVRTISVCGLLCGARHAYGDRSDQTGRPGSTEDSKVASVSLCLTSSRTTTPVATEMCLN